MKFIEKKIIFSFEKLNDKFIELFKLLYGNPMHWDDTEKTRIRKADLEDGSMAPIPVLNENNEKTGDYYIVALWPDKFIEDIKNYPNISLLPCPEKTKEMSEEDYLLIKAKYDLTCADIIEGLKDLKIEDVK